MVPNNFEMQKLRDDRSQDTRSGKNCINLNAQVGICIIILLLHVLSSLYNSMPQTHMSEMVYEKKSAITSFLFFAKFDMYCKNITFFRFHYDREIIS